MSDPYNPAYAAVCLAVTLAVLRLVTGRGVRKTNPSRFDTIDGLRGYLAFFVFLHHSAFWYKYVKAGSWDVPPSHLFAHFGQSSVLFFFMITGLLFFSKLRAGRRAPIDWLRLYVSRVLRLVPLYLFMLLLLYLIVGAETGFVRQEPVGVLANEAIQWLSFCAFHSPSINGFGATWLVTAGVTWSLTFEWLFYLSLPLLGAAIAPLRWVLFSAVTVLLFIFFREFYKTTVTFSFGSGIFAAMCAAKPGFQKFARSRWSTVFVLVPLAVAVIQFPVAYEWGPLFPYPADFYVLGLLTVAFVAIAAGNSVFGILTHPLSKKLGDLSYGIYLLQGIVLYVTFRFVVGTRHAASLSPPAYWGVIAIAGVCLTLLSLLMFRYLEHPCMLLVNGVTHRLRTLGRRSARE